MLTHPPDIPPNVLTTTSLPRRSFRNRHRGSGRGSTVIAGYQNDFYGLVALRCTYIYLKQKAGYQFIYSTIRP
jgi:hypothetical protein